MNTLLPNLNAAPVTPSVRCGSHVDPQPKDTSSSSFSTNLREAADRSSDNNQVKSNQAAAPSQPAQEAQNQQNAMQITDVQSTQSTQQADDSDKQVDAKKDDKDAEKDKDKIAAADSADKASVELLALVAAGQSAAQMTQQATPPIAAPTQALSDAWNGQAKDAKTSPAGGSKPGTPAPDNQAAAKDAATGKDDTIQQTSTKSNDTADLGAAPRKASVEPLVLVAAGQSAAQMTQQAKDAETNPAGASKPGTPAPDSQAAAKDAATDKNDTIQHTSTKSNDTAAAKSAHLQVLTGAATGNDNSGFNPALQQVLNSASAIVTGSTSATANKRTPTVGAPGWDAALGQKMVWMSNNGQQTATLTLNPPDLGPMQIVINVHKNTSDASFIAANPEAKHALEADMPKLREMMDQAGLPLSQTNVSTGMPNQQQAFSQQPQRRGSGRGQNGHRQGSDPVADNLIAGAAGTAPISNGGGLGVINTFV